MATSAYVAAWRERFRRFRESEAELAREARQRAVDLADFLRRRYGVRRILLVGSLARGDFHAESDIDLLVEGLDEPVHLRAMAQTEEIAGRQVDLVRYEDLEPTMRALLEREAIAAVTGIGASQVIALRDHLARALADLDRLVSVDVADALSGLAGPGDARPAILHGGGAVLHSFYTGLENAFEEIARRLDAALPRGPSWYRDLLIAMAHERRGVRPAVIDEATYDALQEYLAFRHVFRELYVFRLRRDRVAELLAGVAAIWAKVRMALVAFDGFLGSIVASAESDG